MDPSVLVGRGAEPSCSSNPIIANGAYLGPKIPRPQFHAKPGPTIVFMGPVRSFSADRQDVLVWPPNHPDVLKGPSVDGGPHREGHGSQCAQGAPPSSAKAPSAM
jgi:hypothetical protein